MLAKGSEMSVSERIKKIKELLMRWETTGLPAGLKLPRSLNQLGGWELLQEYGIPCGFSKRDLNSKHRLWGGDVVAITQCLNRLNVAPRKTQVYQPERVRRMTAEHRASKFEQILVQITAQWHETRHECEVLEARLRQSENKVALRDAEIAALKNDNAELVRNLNLKQILKVVK